MNNNRTTSGGLGVIGVLTIVFVVLKLTGLITWSWIWALAPLWIGLSICIVLVAVLILVICRKFK